MKKLILILMIINISCQSETTIKEQFKPKSIADIREEKRMEDSIMNDPGTWIEDYYKFKIENDIFIGETILDTIYNEKKRLKSIGYYAIDSDLLKSEIKIDKWKEMYENGQIKVEGNYSIGSYMNCCAFGPCQIFYNYKSGKWNYFHQNGTIKASGSYNVQKSFISTNCTGRDSIFFGKLTNYWVFKDNKGKEIKLSNSAKQEFERVNTGGESLADFYEFDYEKNQIKRIMK